MQLYSEADQLLHLLSQVIAKVNKVFVPSKEDDSHTNLYFDSVSKAIYGRWFQKGHKRYIFSLNLIAFQFELLDERKRIEIKQDIVDKTIFEVEQELIIKLTKKGFKAESISKPLHFIITEYDFANNPIQFLSEESISQWLGYRSLANYACLDFIGLTQISSEIRIWPHHFDTGIYFEPTPKLGIGFGLAMEDNKVGNPYFYISAYPIKTEIDYTKIDDPQIGKWIILDDWKGCVLSLEEIGNKAIQKQLNQIGYYIEHVYHWLINQ
ncbi:hypothetical protein [Sediminitomix flava]|uniref:Uncharacterized protein n=1 Tax=Sediminitomix flava TaxID=379075 RepID=A0A315Z5T7_SEDFL|nr:hypothetical protein [Sediminitomix flava]PWJ38637.1 hypothetical protein BC781_107228 [Sediminitomix flava]